MLQGDAVTLTGTATQINAALAGATYSGGHNYNGPDTLTVAVTTDSVERQHVQHDVCDRGRGHDDGIGNRIADHAVAENNAATLPLSNYVTVVDTPNIGDPLSTVLTVTNGTITAGGHTEGRR